VGSTQSRSRNPDLRPPPSALITPPPFAGLTFERPRIMGVVNVTPDSFSDGGDFIDPGLAIDQGLRLVADGADLVDVGGESTRPGSDPVPEDEELRRVLPVVQGLAGQGVLVSIDSRRSAVMRAAVDAGAAIVNDVTALTYDPAAMAVVAGAGVPVVLMHMRGEPKTMQQDPVYDDAPVDVRDYLAERVAACEAAGIDRSRIALDPGIGFGKTVTHNLQILNRLDVLGALGCAVVLGISRKSMIAKLDRDVPPKDRVAGSIAAALQGIRRGAHILRVHDVAETRQAVAIWLAVEEAG